MRTTGLSYAWFAAFLFLVGATVVGCGESGDEAPTDKTSAKSTKSEPPPTYLPGMPFAITKMAVKKIGISGPAVFSPSGDDVLTASYGQSVLWDAKKGLVRRTFKTKGFTVKSVAFSPNGRLVLCGGARTKGQPSTSPTSRPAKGAKRETVGEATLWNLGSTEAAQTFTGHGKGVSRAIFSPDGRQVLTGADDGTVALWDLKTSKRTRTLKVARKEVDAVAFSPDGRRIVTGRYAGSFTEKRPGPGGAIVWDLASGKALQTLRGHMGAVYSVAFSPDGTRVLTGSWDHLAILWDVKTGRQLRRFGHSGWVVSVAFSPNGRRVLTSTMVAYGSSPGAAFLRDAATGALVRTFKGHTSAVQSAAFSADGRRIVTACEWDSAAIVWDAVEREPDAAALAKKNKELAELRKEDADNFAAGHGLHKFLGHASTVTGAAFGPDAKTVVTASRDGTAVLWNRETGERLRTFEGHTNWINAVAYSTDGRRILTGSDDKTAILWDADSGKQIHVLKWHEAPVHSVAFSPDGKSVLTGSVGRSGMAALWDAQTGQQKRAFTLPDTSPRIRPMDLHENVLSVSFSPDGKLALIAGALQNAGGVAVLWDVQTGKNGQIFTGHTSGVTSALVTRDGAHVMTGSRDGLAILWDLKTGKKLAEFDHSKVVQKEFDKFSKPLKKGQFMIRGGRTAVNTIALSPDGKCLLTAGKKLRGRPCLAVLWNVQTRKPVRILKTHMGDIASSAFSADGTRALTGAADDLAIIWDVSKATATSDGQELER